MGIRHQVQEEPDPNWLLHADVRRGLIAVAEAGLVHDPVVKPHQLAAAVPVAADLPDPLEPSAADQPVSTLPDARPDPVKVRVAPVKCAGPQVAPRTSQGPFQISLKRPLTCDFEKSGRQDLNLRPLDPQE
ncbi:hypothetical protein GCM10010222_74680 [Streptomyces tanashiensis]|nr:hypothetical protein GCM10010222_74680 [Streptomyces tanashiensis]